MRTLLVGVALCGVHICTCRPSTPQSANELANDEQSTTSTTTTAERSEPDSSPRPTPDIATASTLVDELTAVISAAVVGRDLPDTVVRLPGSRGEQVVSVVGQGFPEGTLVAEASIFKLDITLDGCGEEGGLALGLFQTQQGVFIIGLGDQFNASSGPSAVGHDDVASMTDAMLRVITEGSASEYVLHHDRCEEILGNMLHCRRMFQELPDDDVLDRYGQMLPECESTPVVMLAFVGLLLRDERGTSFQGIARFAANEGELSLSEPITIAPGLP